jgi:hypothetical protein
MEVTQKGSNQRGVLKRFLFHEPKPFSDRQEINWKTIRKIAIGCVTVGVVVILALPAPKPDSGPFHEKMEAGSTAESKSGSSDPTTDTLAQLQRSHSSFVGDYLNSGGSVTASGVNQNRNTPMILMRGGLDSKTQMPPGSRLAVRLTERLVVASQPMPVIGVTTRDYLHEDYLAVPQGSKVFGEVSFDESAERAQVSWRSIQFPDGRERQISAVGLGIDGHAGVEGNVHSDGLKNTIGLTLSTLIGGYFEGSMQRGTFGASEGGHENGVKNALAQTAKTRGEGFAEDLKKERKWIELEAGTECLAVLNQSFLFRDPGGTYGQ